MMKLQQECFNNIKTLCANYKKDGRDRKTEDYLVKRLESLEVQWKDFQTRHASLLETTEDKNIHYFTEDVFGNLKEMYQSTKEDMEGLLLQIREQKAIVFDMSGMLEDEDDKSVTALLEKQQCNFKALDRVMSKIDKNADCERWELEDHLSILKAKWDTVDKQHWELEPLLNGSNFKYYNMFVAMEGKYDEMRRFLNSKIWSTSHYEKSVPKMEVPEFSGNYVQWISFKDLFKEAIHNNPMINKAQKMQHLKTRLRGEAERLVQHLSISADNYQSCWDILTQRYDNRRLQFTSFINTMLNLPVIQQPDSHNLKKMHDVITECLNGLANIGIDTSTWDPLIVHLMSLKFDSTTYTDYMKELQDHRELQPLSDFLYFVESKFMAYETMKNAKKEVPNIPKTAFLKPNYKSYPFKRNHYELKKTYYTTYGQCPNCGEGHVLMQCPKFIDMHAAQRNNTVAKLHLCKNCLYSHGSGKCTSTKTCKECNMKHHTLLHYFTKPNLPTGSNYAKDTTNLRPSTSAKPCSNHLATDEMEILLPTALLQITSANGTQVKLRALLDQGSQVNLITEKAAQLLRLPRSKLNATISGVGSISGDCKGRLQLNCQSIHSDYSFVTQALVMKKLTNNLPNSTFERTNWPHLENLKLADPEFNLSRPIDLLLGADVYSDILLAGVLKGSQQSPIAQQTQLGWILCGKLKTLNCHVALVDLSEITKYWESEDIVTVEDMSKDDYCEDHYSKTVQRNSDGKYIVKMPFCPDYEEKIGDSRSIAISQFLQLEKRLERNRKLALMYRDFINEYTELGHMKPSRPMPSYLPQFYLPHHGVLREQSTTTKLRVVFNASQKSSNGVSLNQLQEKGPNLQRDIQALILKWRSYQYAYTADIEKMYRCIEVAQDQQPLQKIIWRDSPTDKLKEYELNTVTYGMKCAPWLAMRTLKQLAIDDGEKHPEAAAILLTEFYVDDLVSGHNSIPEANQLQLSLIQLLRGAGMNLRKWSANDPALLQNLDEDQISSTKNFEFKDDESMKTLGLRWDPKSDTFTFHWDLDNKLTTKLTKRRLLSEISKIYDPLGWLSPITITAKLIFQRVWTSKVEWDEDLPMDIQKDWLKLKTELPVVKDIQLHRWLGGEQENIQLMCFCDASEKAYSCVIYSYVIKSNDPPAITLLAAKTRVAPLAQKTSLPRMELCGALLLAQLVEKTKQAYKGYNLQVRAWCDSQVVLAWLQGDVSRWEKYVANRVTKIKQVIPSENWQYVKSEQNPADCASRGLYPNKLLDFHLWWKGPEFLTTLDNGMENAPKNYSCLFTTNIELKTMTPTTLTTNQDDNFINNLLHKCSSLSRVTRVVAWIMRFCENTRSNKKPNTEFLTSKELTAANEQITKYVQHLQLDNERKQLTKNEGVSSKSAIHKLNPYLDAKGIIRVGGRLNNSTLPTGMKNPIIVPGKWAMGRVMETHPGADGHVRVTTIKTQTGTTKHPIVKLSPLPLETEVKTETKSEDSERKERTKRCGKKTFFTLFTTLISMSCLITGTYGASGGLSPNAHITSLEPDRPIYYDTIGKMQMIHDEWILLMYYNLTNYWTNIQKIETYLQGLNELCEKTDPRYCQTTLEQIKHEKELLDYYNYILLSPHKHLSERKKRGLIDGVGTIARSLFGVLDQQFADKYEQDIDAIQNNENYLLGLIKNQTSIVELENKVLKKTEDNMNRQCTMLEAYMNQTDANMAKIETTIEAMMATSYFNSASLTTYLLIKNMKEMQEMLFDSLTDVYKGHLDIHLLTPVKLLEQLNVISGKLPKSLTLPIENVREDIRNIYKLLYAKARVTTNYFLFEVHIPLTSDEDFLLYRAIPLPVPTENKTTTVQLKSQYIAVNFEKGTYISASEEDVKLCNQLKPGIFICYKNLPVFNLHNNQAPCEAKLLSHRSEAPCDVKATPCSDVWIALHSPNSWLAICCGACTLRTVCNSDVTAHMITTTSLVTLAQGCVLQSRDFTIYSHNEYNTKMKMDDFIFNVPDLNTTVNNIVDINHHRLSLMNSLDTSGGEIQEIDRRTQLLKENEVLPSRISGHDIHQYALGYGLLGAAILGTVIWIIIKRRTSRYCIRSNKSEVTTQPTYEDIELQDMRPPPSRRPPQQPRAQHPRRVTAAEENIAFNFDV